MESPDITSPPPPTGDEVAKKHRPAHGLYLILLGVFVAAVLGGAAYLRHIAYVAGLTNDFSLYIKWWVRMTLPSTVLAVAMVIYGIVRLYVKPCGLRPAWLKPLILLAPLLAFVASLLILRPMPAKFLTGFEKWASAHIDVPGIQQWLATEGSRLIHTDTLYAHESFPEWLPESLVDSRPYSIAFRITLQGQLIADLAWPGGFSELCGVVVGPVTMKTPESGRDQTSRGSFEYRRPLKTGAYLFYSLQAFLRERRYGTLACDGEA